MKFFENNNGIVVMLILRVLMLEIDKEELTDEMIWYLSCPK